MATNKGDVQDAILAVTRHLAKGLGVAPQPGFEDSAAGVAATTTETLLAAAATAAAGLPNLHRYNVQAIGVSERVTATLAP